MKKSIKCPECRIGTLRKTLFRNYYECDWCGTTFNKKEVANLKEFGEVSDEQK